jgi:hypothetical protein
MPGAENYLKGSTKSSWMDGWINGMWMNQDESIATAG